VSFVCAKCSADLNVEERIPVIGYSDDDTLAKSLDYALRHMAAMHPEVVDDINSAAAGIGYLVMVSNLRTTDKAIEARTKVMLEQTVKKVNYLEQELSTDPERFLRAF
jgi:elongation factor P hydroxylase